MSLKKESNLEDIGEFPGLKIGDEISNEDLTSIFRCSPQGGMRRSIKTNSLVLISDRTKGWYYDVWKTDVFHYTGMGLKGDQSLSYRQNKTLNYSKTNGVKIYLFEVHIRGKYRYYGQVELASAPYQTVQRDYQGYNRKVWIFPVKRVTRVASENKEIANSDVEPISEDRIHVEKQSQQKQVSKPLNNELNNNTKNTNENRGLSNKSTTVTQNSRIPAELTCTVEDFHVFVGDKIKNAIPNLTRRERKSLEKVCQRCHKKVSQIDSAHVHGFERDTIIDNVIRKYLIDENRQVIHVDLEKVVQEILDAHLPISEHFKFLCPECHRKYDSSYKK